MKACLLNLNNVRSSKYFSLLCSFVLLLLFASTGYTAERYVRPVGEVTNGDGRSYENAWAGFSNIVWGGESGVNAGDTLCVCGTHVDDSLTIQKSGDLGKKITIDGKCNSCPDDNKCGKIIGAKNMNTLGDWSRLSLNDNKWATANNSFPPDEYNGPGFVLLGDEAQNNMHLTVMNEGDLDQNEEAFWDWANNRMIIYASDNPASVYGQIWISHKYVGVLAKNKAYIEIKNIEFKYQMISAIRMNSAKYCDIKNVKASYYGGGNDSVNPRAGDGVTFDGNGTTGITVSHSDFSQCFDFGLAMQLFLDSTHETASNITFENNTVDRCGAGISVAAHKPDKEIFDVYVRNNVITNSGLGWSGVNNSVHGKGIEIKEFEGSPHADVHDIYIADNIVNTYTWAGIMMWEGDAVIQRNEIKNGNGYYFEPHVNPAGILIHGSDYESGVSPDEATALITNNLIFNNEGHGIYIVNNTPDPNDAGYVEIYNNTLYNNGNPTYPSFYSTTSSGTQFRNNIVYSTNSLCFSGDGTTEDHNLFYPSDPRFVFQEDGNFHLESNSPAIDQGINVGLRSDFDGNIIPWGNGPDIGAYEYCIDSDGDLYCDNLDCSDFDPSVHPDAVEICDGADNNCDTQIDENLTHATTCGAGACVGNTGVEICSSGTWNNNTCDPFFGAVSEICDGIDNDCDGYVDEDNDGDGFNLCADCDDNNASVSPGAIEICNDGFDNDCDGTAALCSPANWHDDGSGGEWEYRQPVTIQTGMTASDLDNFPVLIKITDAGNSVFSQARADGDDIVFTDSNGNKLAHEIEKYDAAEGILATWVKLPVLSSTGNNIYMYYGNNDINLPTQQNKEGVWDGNYVMVQHLSETALPGALPDDPARQHHDSTANGNDSNSVNVAAQAIAGKIGGADEFTVGKEVVIPDDSSLDLIGDTPVTYSAWIYSRSRGQQGIMQKPSGGISAGYRFGINGPDCGYGPDSIAIEATRSGQWGGGVCSVENAVTQNHWDFVVYTYNSGTGTIYVNGFQSGDPVFQRLINSDNSKALKIGNWTWGSFDGYIDEVRISNTARSADWITAEYNNQNSPGTYIQFAPQEIVCTDSDNDGYAAEEGACGAVDCNDSNALEHPNQAWYKDADSDGYSDGITVIQCARPVGYKVASELTAISGDCDDTNTSIHTGAVEGQYNDPTCSDGFDNNCDGLIDRADNDCTTFWKPLPLRTQAQEGAGMSGGEGMQMIWGLSYAPVTATNPDAQILYLVTDTSQAWKSVDSGYSWQMIHKGFRANGGDSLVVHPTNENIVFVNGRASDIEQTNHSLIENTASGIYRTTDGESWALVHKTLFYSPWETRGGVNFAFSGTNIIYAGTHTEGVLKSTQGGDPGTWNPLNILVGQKILDIKIDPLDNNILFIATTDGFYKLTDEITLELIGDGLPSFPRSIAIHPTDPNIIYVSSGSDGVYKSTDGGASFIKKSNGLPTNKIITYMAMSPVEPDYLYASLYMAGSNHPYYSHNGGESWLSPSVMDEGQLVCDLIKDNAPCVSGNQVGGEYWSTPIAPHPLDKDIAISSAGGNHLEKTINGGDIWKYSGNGYMGGRAGVGSTSFSWDLNNQNRFALFLIDFGPFLTEDGGSTFRSLRVPRFNGQETTPVGALDPTLDSQVIVTAVGSWTNQVIAMTRDNGASWTLFDGGDTYGQSYQDTYGHTHTTPKLEDNFQFMAFHPQNPNIIYTGKYKSTNKGQTWQTLSRPIHAMHQVNGDIVYSVELVNSWTNIYKSLDGGENWELIGNLQWASGYELYADPQNVNRIYLSTYNGVYVYDGAQWTLKANGLAPDSFGTKKTRNITVDPINNNIIYLGKWIVYYGQSDGIYRSTHYGDNWENITYNLGPEFTPWAISVNPHNSQVYIGSSHGTFVLCTDRDYDGYSPEGGTCGFSDCNDNDPAIHPGAIEACNSIDNDCNPGTPDGSGEVWYGQATACGVGECASTGQLTCQSGFQVDTCSSGISQTEVCDGLDNNCDGSADNGLTSPLNDLQSGVCTGSVKVCTGTGGWVNNYRGIANYEAIEITCDTLNNDCDGQTDEGVQTTYYQDADMDTYGNPSATTQACTQSSSYVTNNTDCDDINAAINPATVWYKDTDNDGYSDGTVLTQCLRPAGHKLSTELTATSGDCNDNNASVNTGTIEGPYGSPTCSDTIDNDCDNLTDTSDPNCYAPDLVETSVSNPPTSATNGTAFSVTDSVKNQGAGAAGASATRYYLSSNTAKDSSDALLTGSRSVPGLASNATSNSSATVTVPDIIKGNYYLLACADDTGAVNEGGNETNNCRASAARVSITGPDLVITSIGNPPTSITRGNGFSISSTTKNQGTTSSGTTSYTRFYLSLDNLKDGNDYLLTGSRTIPSLSTGATSSGSVTVGVPSSTPTGLYYVIGCSDDTGLVSESHETNNCKIASRRVQVNP